MIATHDPRPRVTMTASPRSAAQSATLTIRSFGAGASFGFLVTRPLCDRCARAALPARDARAPGRTASRPCPAAACRRRERLDEEREEALLHRPVEVDHDVAAHDQVVGRSEEHTSELQSRYVISYAVF